MKSARDRLYAAIGEGQHIGGRPFPSAGRATDRQALDDLIQRMTETRAMDFLRDADFGGWSFQWLELVALDDYVQFPRGAEREFIDRDLEALRQKFIAAYDAFRPLLVRNTAPTKHNPDYRTVPMEWEETDPRRYTRAVKMLRTAADKVCVAYDELVRLGRERLAP